MNELIEANYKSIVDRGFIAPSTNYLEFIDKLNDEVGEFKSSLGGVGGGEEGGGER